MYDPVNKPKLLPLKAYIFFGGKFIELGGGRMFKFRSDNKREKHENETHCIMVSGPCFCDIRGGINFLATVLKFSSENFPEF